MHHVTLHRYVPEDSATMWKLSSTKINQLELGRETAHLFNHTASSDAFRPSDNSLPSNNNGCLYNYNLSLIVHNHWNIKCDIDRFYKGIS